jgi:hypothetical protein
MLPRHPGSSPGLERLRERGRGACLTYLSGTVACWRRASLVKPDYLDSLACSEPVLTPVQVTPPPVDRHGLPLVVKPAEVEDGNPLRSFWRSGPSFGRHLVLRSVPAETTNPVGLDLDLGIPSRTEGQTPKTRTP